MAKVNLTLEEQTLLKRLEQETLIFFNELKDHKKFFTFTDLITTLIDLEKNMFFTGSINDTAESLLRRYEFSRGNIAGLLMLKHIILGASFEIGRRDRERSKREEESKIDPLTSK